MYNFVRLNATLENNIRQKVWPESYYANFGKYEKTTVNTFLEVQYS